MTSIKKIKTEPIAVFAVDPGETTGIAAGLFKPLGTLRETVTNGRLMHKTAEVYGEYLEQASELASLMWRFQYTMQVEQGVPAENIHFVYEDFVLRRRREGGATGNLTSCWVAAAAVALYSCHGVTIDSYGNMKFSSDESLPVVWQQPSEAYFYKNDLKRFGLWEKGSEHKRVANMHICCRVSKVLG